MSKAITDAEAIEIVQRALAEYASQVGPTAAQAEREMEKIATEVSRYAEFCSREIRQLEQALRVLRDAEEPDERAITEKTRQLDGWCRKLSDTKQLGASLSRDHATYRGHQRRYAQAIEPVAESGRARMRTAREQVIKYEKTQSVRTQAASRRWKPIRGGGGAAGDVERLQR